MKIRDVEEITGITKQNIRYYERKGLLSPDRNEENDYREYSKEDVRDLQMIKLFRKLDMPIEEIRRLLYNDTDLQEALLNQKKLLETEKERLDDALKFCGKITEHELTELDVEHYLDEMKEEEHRGARFADFINDYRRVARAEAQREFTFTPDTMCMNAREFTEALCKYGRENELNLVITKEGMYPEFTIDGIEYEADRRFSRFGAVVRCKMKYPKEAIPKGMSVKKYNKYKLFRDILIPVAMASVILLVTGFDSAWKTIPIVIAIIVAGKLLWSYYYRNLKN